MKLRKSTSLLLIFSLIFSCIPVQAGKIRPGGSAYSMPKEVGAAVREEGSGWEKEISATQPDKEQQEFESTPEQPFFGKHSVWSDWFKWRRSLPEFLTNSQTGKSHLYPEGKLSPTEKFTAEMFESRIKGNFSWRRLPETVLSYLPKKVGQKLSFDHLKSGLYKRLPVPALAADIAVGAVDSALAGKPAEEIIQKGIIRRAARSVTNIALLWAISKAGTEASDHLGLQMPSNKFAANALWLASIPVFWVAEDLKDLAVDVVVESTIKPFMRIRQKINHSRNQSIWEHNKQIFDAHFTDQLMIGPYTYDYCVEKFQELKQNTENKLLQAECLKVLKQQAKGKYAWTLREGSDSALRVQALGHAKTGFKNDQCPECWQSLREGRVDEVCCIGRYSF